MVESPLDKVIPNLETQTYILAPEGLYYLSDESKYVSKENIIRLDESKISLDSLWEQLGSNNKTPHDEELRWLSSEEDLIIQKTGHSRKERRIQGFKIKGDYILEWHLEDGGPGPTELRIDMV